MKKKLAMIASGVLAAALLFGAIVTSESSKGELMADAPRRAPSDSDVVYIEPDLTALAANLSGTAESKAAARAAFDLINSHRSEMGLSTLRWNNGLEQAAAVRAVEASEVWSHTRPDGSQYYTVNEGLVYGENLARNYTTAQSAFDAWMDSPTHRDNIEFPDFETAAIAVHIDGGTWYWANEFGY